MVETYINCEVKRISDIDKIIAETYIKNQITNS